MFLNNFNKIGGTEFRVKKQILNYTYLINWIQSKKNKDIKDWNSKFIEMCVSENIYNYKSDDKIKRFNMVVSNLTTHLNILIKEKHNNCIKYKLNPMFDLNKPESSFLLFLQNEYKKMIFIYLKIY